jgi:type II restriction enzyme
MDLQLDLSIAKNYHSPSQIARVVTENWVGTNPYCPSCGNNRLTNFTNNSPVADFYCINCSAEYELKSKKNSLTEKIVDGAFATMLQRINSENNPNFFFLNYSNQELTIKNFLVIPKYYFVNNIIEKRKPLSITARRAGWIGCNILLQNIPESGKIFFIKDSKIEPKDEVLKSWTRTSFLGKQKKDTRGWTIEIMKVLDRIQKKSFSLDDVYKFGGELQQKFPNNSFVKDKIRQQLQVLRDKDLIEFKGGGQYFKK